MAEEEVVAEVEAVEAVYGDDCLVLEKYHPHLHIHIKPRTADVSSQQFVEATVGIRASSKYPDEPPCISMVDSKGLDEQRQKYLISSICDNAAALTSFLMLVALCEGAVEKLSSMNHPDGNCSLCLYPLVDEDDTLQFMKLMSCFHCFHCECIIRWWNWLRMQKEDDSNVSQSSTSLKDMEDQQGRDEMTNDDMGKCPVCRKLFLAKDIEHVLDLVGTHSELNSAETIVLDGDNLLQSDSEKIRRQKFESILKLQQENSGLIEPKKHEVLLPGMFLPRPVSSTSTNTDNETKEEGNKNQGATSRGIQNGLSKRPSIGKHKNFSARKHTQRGRNPGKHVRQWIRKEDGPASCLRYLCLNIIPKNKKVAIYSFIRLLEAWFYANAREKMNYLE